MSYEETLKSFTLEADASLGIYTGVPGLPGSAVPNSGMQYRFVKITGTRQCGLCVLATNIAVGIMQNKPQRPGAAATVSYMGISNITSGAAIVAGAIVASDTTGRAVTDAVNGKWQALAPAAGAGELIPVLRVI
jgi:hypothetical protein